jgi:hypothetical protein
MGWFAFLELMDWFLVDTAAAGEAGQALDGLEGVRAGLGIPGVVPDELFFDYVGFYNPNPIPNYYDEGGYSS